MRRRAPRRTRLCSASVARRRDGRLDVELRGHSPRSLAGEVAGLDRRGLDRGQVGGELRARRVQGRLRIGAELVDLLVDDEVLAERRLDLKFPEPRYTKGVLAKYAKLALGAEFGAVTSA